MTAQASYDECFSFEVRALEERNTPVSAFPGNQFLTDVTSNRVLWLSHSRTVQSWMCSMSESLVGDWKAVGVLERTGSNHDDIDESPNSTSADSNQLENSSSNLSGVEVVHTQSSEEKRKDQEYCPIFV